MRILFDIVHPAHALFFKNAIEQLHGEGAQIAIASRQKDVVVDLLDSWGFDHRPVSKSGRGVPKLAIELVKRDLAVLQMARRFRPDVMVGFGGVAISHVGKLLGIPAIAFYDSDNATLQTSLTWPFITHVYAPESYDGPLPAGRHSYFPGPKERAFLEHFVPDRGTALRCGYDESRDNFLVRTVNWNANHDLGKAGWDADTLRDLVATLSAHGRVHLSAEGELPADLAPHAYQGRPEDLHHLMARCRAYVGESMTMSRECAMLGVPALTQCADSVGIAREMHAEGLVIGIVGGGREELMDGVSRLLAIDQTDYVKRRDAYLAKVGGLTDFVINAIRKAALS